MTPKAIAPGSLLALAERVESLDGPDAETNKDILEATGGCAHRETKYYYIEDGNDTDSGFTCLRCGKDTYGEKVPPFTASLDAAMTLVPAGIRIVSMGEDMDRRWDACVCVRNSADVVLIDANATTPALALCAAALKARAHQSGEQA